MDSKKIQTSKNCVTANSLGTYASKRFSASLKCLTSIGFMMICTMTAWADGSGNCGNTEGNVKWEFTSSTGTLRIYPNTSDPNGTDFAMADYEWDNYTAVPWNDYKDNITSVVIEDGVTTIGGYNFYQLTALTSVSIGKDVTTIGTNDCAFDGCTALTSITIPASVTTIGAFAFRNCTNLADITLTKEENITSVDGSAFDDTAWLNAQPDGVVYLGKVAYGIKGNSINVDVTITDGTVAIADGAFGGKAISSVTIPNSITYIGKLAFSYCGRLTAVYVLPATPPGLDSVVDLFSGNRERVNSDQKFFVHGNGYNSGKWKDLWEDMKDNNNNWNEDNNITIIGTVTTPEGITASGTPTVSHSGIDYYAEGATITLSGGTNYVVTKTSDGTDVTSEVLSGSTLTMPDYDVTIGEVLGGNCGNTEGNVKWEFTSSTGTLRIYPNTSDPNGTDFAMADYEWDNYTAVPWNDYKDNITSVVIEDGVTTIGGYNFYQLTALTSVSIGKDVTTIGTNDCAFDGCTALTSITIPASVTTIGAFAFRNCTNLADITLTKEENITSVDGSAFDDTAWLNAQPDGVVYLGKVAYGFKGDDYVDVTIKDGTVAIADGAFNGTYISSVTIPNSVTYIGQEAFNNCGSLTTVYVLPATPPELGKIYYLFTGDDAMVNTYQKFFVHGNGYNSDDWKDLWEDMVSNGWSSDNITIIGTVTTPEGITASGTPTVSHSGIDYYKKGETITLNVTGEVPTGYSELLGYTVKDADGGDVTVSENAGVYTFTMPAGDVTVTANWSVNNELSLTANEATLLGVTKYWTTFYHPTLSYQLPEGAQAFYMKSDKALYRVSDGNIIPTGVPVIIMSDKASITLTKVNDIDLSVTDNILQGTSAATAVGSLSLTEGQKVYVLSKVGNDFGFFEFEGTIPANKAYINEE